jgi:hypothetical protein
MTTQDPHVSLGNLGRVLRSKNVLAGLMFMAIAVAGLWISRNYPVGTALRMGTGYMPRLLLWLLLLLGAVIMLQGAREADAQPPSPGRTWQSLRPIIFVSASIVAFALCIERLGLVLSIVVLVLVGSLAHRQLRFVETLLTGAVLLVLSLAVFIFGLDLTIPVWPDW